MDKELEPKYFQEPNRPLPPGFWIGMAVTVLLICLIYVCSRRTICTSSFEKERDSTQVGPKTVSKEQVTHCKPYLSVEDSCYLKSDSISDAVLTRYFYITTNGVKYPIYMSSTGECFIVKTNTKTGKQYKQYLSEVSKQLKYE